MLLCDKDVRIILVRPRNPLNIGAAARAMLNFGFEDLVVVSPYDPVWQEAKSAVGAERVLRQARVAANLLQAVEDRTLVIGTSSLSRRRVSQPAIPLELMSTELKKTRRKHRLAVVFGPEKTGLSNEDLSYCHWIARIPTVSACPSMNLGQAVAVCCYELKQFMDAKIRTAANRSGAAPVGEIERLSDELERLLRGSSEPFRSPKRARKARFRQMLFRWGISSEDIALVLGVLRDLSWQLQHKS